MVGADLGTLWNELGVQEDSVWVSVLLSGDAEPGSTYTHLG